MTSLERKIMLDSHNASEEYQANSDNEYFHGKSDCMETVEKLLPIFTGKPMDWAEISRELTMVEAWYNSEHEYESPENFAAWHKGFSEKQEEMEKLSKNI